MKRIVFFSKDDGASFYMVEKIDAFFKQKRHEDSISNVNDILELHHIIEYLENGFVYLDWKENDVIFYKSCSKEFKNKISTFFRNLSAEKTIEIFDELEFDYTKTFWLLVNKHGSYKALNEYYLNQLNGKRRFYLREILFCKKIVEYFDTELTALLMEDTKNAELILDYFEASHDRIQQEKFFPKSFGLQLREKLILDYLDQGDTNLNFVRLIAKSKDSENIRFSDKTKLKARKIAKRINDEILDSGNTFVIRKGVCLSDDQEEVNKIVYKDDEEIYSYSRKKLLENIDLVTLFKNFKYVFEFLDFQGVIDFVVRESEVDSFERTFIRSKNEFILCSSFSNKSMIGMLKFEIYKYFLDSINISLEDVLENYVNDYLNKTYNINKLKLHLPSVNSSYLEKIRLLAPEFESLLEQYKLYVEDDIVDYELLQISTKTSKISNIPSLVEKKYVYPIGEEYQILRFNFFNNMSSLFDYEKWSNKYKNFYHVLLYEVIFVDDFSGYRKDYVQHFLDNNYLKLNEDTSIAFVNNNLLIIVGYLNNFDVMSYWSYPKYIRDEIDEMETNRLVRFSNKLFTEGEQAYFDFYLNNRFSNGYWLRNKYVHATNSHDEEEQKKDYGILLRLMVLFVLKIEDDLQIGMNLIISSKTNHYSHKY